MSSDDRIRETIDGLLDARRAGATICPSDAARALRPDGDWRALMDDVRRVAADEAGAGRLELRQGGRPVDPSGARGPIRLGRPPRAGRRLTRRPPGTATRPAGRGPPPPRAL
ncbi:DUF3253 domain-containing protein [Patulibacter sp. NPDC049589]|uniref:DUF3253 domain-containing protein n=1 Tax=Patulibacter sp. NPDC049589 TaxID=3154731 RepID=UPI0034390CC4